MQHEFLDLRYIGNCNKTAFMQAFIPDDQSFGTGQLRQPYSVAVDDDKMFVAESYVRPQSLSVLQKQNS